MRLSRKAVKPFLLVVLALLLTVALTACPQVVVGSIKLAVDATRIDRCDDGIKAVLEIRDGSLMDINYSLEENDFVYGAGDYWVWVKPGQYYAVLFQTTRAFNQNAQNETFTVKAHCMRKDAEPGVSERTFDAGMFLTEAGVVSTQIKVSDTGEDPDYTMTPPGLTIDYPHP